jgi:hypothetical protein
MRRNGSAYVATRSFVFCLFACDAHLYCRDVGLVLSSARYANCLFVGVHGQQCNFMSCASNWSAPSRLVISKCIFVADHSPAVTGSAGCRLASTQHQHDLCFCRVNECFRTVYRSASAVIEVAVSALSTLCFIGNAN